MVVVFLQHEPPKPLNDGGVFFILMKGGKKYGKTYKRNPDTVR